MFKRLLVIIFFISISLDLYANLDKDLLDFDDIDIPVESSSNEGFSYYWDEHFIGRSGLYFINSTDWNRFSKFLTSTYEESWNRFKFNSEIRYVQSTLNATFEYETSNFNSSSRDSSESNETINTSDFEFRQLFFEYDINDYLNLSLGKQTIVWGQGSYMSPIDMLLPPDFFSLKTSMTKKERRVPLEAAQLNVYPVQDVEVQFVYIPRYKTMELGALNDNIKESIEENPSTSIDDYIDTPNGKKGEAQYAIRTMYYSKWGTFGLTYFEGWFWMPLPTPNLDIDNFKFKDQFLSVVKQQTFGLEYSKVIGKSTYSIEYVRLNIPFTISTNVNSLTDNPRYLNWIIQNDYKAYADMNLDIVSTGWDYVGERWITNIYLNYIFPKFSDRLKQGLEANNDSVEVTVIPLPVINLARYIGNGENKMLGFAFGYYGATFGASLYYDHEIKEVFTLRLGLEALIDFAEARPEYLEVVKIDDEGNEQSYWRKNGANLGPSIAITYKF